MSESYPPVEVHRAEPSDADAIESVAEAAWEADYPDVLHRENVAEAAAEWYETSSMADSLSDPRTVAYVACLESEAVVGFVHAYDDSGRDRPDARDVDEETADGYVFRAYVHPDYRERGIGTDLLEAAVTGLHDRDCDRIRANVLAQNEPGQSFYAAHGFEREGITGETEVGGEYYEELSFVRER
jgi:ribosomal protein S18 acetylase RimI-like enzyme